MPLAAPADADLATVRGRIDALQAADEVEGITPMLVAVSRELLENPARWSAEDRQAFAETLRDHGQFAYARRLLGRLRHAGHDSVRLCQQHALTTYKDTELSAARRLDRALEILTRGGGDPLEACENSETLGLAGAIYKRRWEVDAKRADLESALRCYEWGYARALDNVKAGEHDDSWYPAINAAFVCDQLASLETEGLGTSQQAARLRARADEIREQIIAGLTGTGEWVDATLGEACFGLGRFDDARDHFGRARAATQQLWRRESTAVQVAALGRLRRMDSDEATAALQALLGTATGGVARAHIGKVGLALSGGGFRASLFHIGVLARLAECDVLRHVEVLSCVSGGSIVGAYYYLKLRMLLRGTHEDEITRDHYVALVDDLQKEFLAGVQSNLRARLSADASVNWRMLSSGYSRTDRVGELLEELFYSQVHDDARDDPDQPWLMTELRIAPQGQPHFSLRDENWLRLAKVPVLVVNATTLNTGHNWQFTASWMGEPPAGGDEQPDAVPRLRRVYYDDAPEEHRKPRLGMAVSASACVPGLFTPVILRNLYEALDDVALVDGGVHDNQGIASLLQQDCTVMLISDASGQIRDSERPPRRLFGVTKRSNTVLMSRVRGAQFAELAGRKRSQTLRGLMVVHLMKRLPARPRNWRDCQEPFDPIDDAPAPGVQRTGLAYAIDPGVQRALAELRTDLDAFSDDEAYSLMAAGYEMTRCELPGMLPDLAGTGPTDGIGHVWGFAAALQRIAAPNAQSGLVSVLGPGRALFFRRFHDFRQRRAGRPRGRLQVAGMRAAGAVLSPVRKAASAPLALVGGLGTRLYLRAKGRRGDRS